MLIGCPLLVTSLPCLISAMWLLLRSSPERSVTAADHSRLAGGLISDAAFVLENDPFYQEDFYWAICVTLSSGVQNLHQSF